MDKHFSILDIHHPARKIRSQERLALPECLPENELRFSHGKTGVGVFDVFSRVCVRDASRSIGFESRSSHHNNLLIFFGFFWFHETMKPILLHKASTHAEALLR